MLVPGPSQLSGRTPRRQAPDGTAGAKRAWWLFTVPQVAEMLSLSRSKVYALVAKGAVEGFRVGTAPVAFGPAEFSAEVPGSMDWIAILW